MAAPTPMLALLERTKRRRPLSRADFDLVCRGAVDGSVPDYQLAAWLMAVWFRGLDPDETLALTQAMVATGAQLDWTDLDRPTVDKHSTGGVGDKTSLVLVPLVAAAGAAFVKMSGRGLGHTGGTLDKLEAIPGLRVELSLAELRAQVRRIGCALVGQSPELVPADAALYALRDVTATVDSLPLIASSVMSKKLAAGAGSIVLDVKWGEGAFLPERARAQELADALVALGRAAGRRTRAVLSPMEQPLGRAVGNALEVREAIDTLAGQGPTDLWALVEALGAELLVLAGLAPDAPSARLRLRALRDDGAGRERFRALVEAQGGDPRAVDDPARLPQAPCVRPWAWEGPGPAWVAALPARALGEIALTLGAGRQKKGDPVDPAVGLWLDAKVGERLEPGQPIVTVHARSPADVEAALTRLRQVVRLAHEPVPSPAFDLEVRG